MDRGLPLHDYLARGAAQSRRGASVAAVVETLAAATADFADVLARGGTASRQGRSLESGPGGDLQRDLDLHAHNLFRQSLNGCSVAAFASEEAAEIEALDPNGTLCVALDPVDGSGNLDLNMAVGTIFSVLAMPETGRDNSATFHWPAGTAQLAAGFAIYGPQTALVLTTGESVDMFTFDRDAQMFRLARQNLHMPLAPPDEYAINGSNYRHWEEPIRAFVDECQAGASGPYGRDFNMRWHGALVAEAYRILTHGGIYLYPGDAREGYRDGRLRLIYEAYPMAFLMECTGGAASTGRRRILDLEAKSQHQRVPLIMGSRSMVEHIDTLHHRPGLWPPTTAPLFASRGLFRS